MTTYLNDAFEYTFYQWGSQLEPSMLDWFKPDYVLAQSNERFLPTCPLC
jgi:hypothetical protein